MNIASSNALIRDSTKTGLAVTGINGLIQIFCCLFWHKTTFLHYFLVGLLSA